jgi:YidC/Oxa1 family membrane protein insertase
MNPEKKRTTLAFVLCLAFMLGWQMFYLNPRQKKEAEARRVAAAEQQAADSRRAAAESRVAAAATAAVEGDAPVAPPTRPEVAANEIVSEVVENPALRLTFSNVGAHLAKAELLQHRRRAKSDEPLSLLHQYAGAARSFELRNLADPKSYVHEQPWRVKREGPRTLLFTLEKGVGTFQGAYRATKRVTLHETAPWIDVAFGFEYLGTSTSKPGTASEQKWRFTPACGLVVDGEAYGTEDLQGIHSSYFRVNDDGKDEYLTIPLPNFGKFEEKNAEGLPVKREGLGGRRAFVADLNTYFGVYTAVTKLPSAVAALTGVADPAATGKKAGVPQRTRVDLEFPITAKVGDPPVEAGLRVYFGPNDEDVVLASAPADAADWAQDFTRVYKAALGMFAFVGRMVLALLHGLHAVVGSWGWAIVLMTVCVRLLLFPINRRSQISMRRHGEAMARIKPKLDELKEKFKDKPQEYAAAQMALMKREKVPMLPLGGCLPLFLQIPVFYGLFSGLRASIDLRQAPFLWVADLSLPDHLITFSSPIVNPMKWFEACACCVPPGMSDTISGLHLLPILMTLAWVANSMAMPKPENETPEQAQQRKMMLFMPLLFGFTMYGYAAGLSLYWLTSSLVGIVESKIIKRQIDRAKKAAA